MAFDLVSLDHPYAIYSGSDIQRIRDSLLRYFYADDFRRLVQGDNTMADQQALTTREQIREFSLAFERPVNESWTDLSVSDRLLLGKLLFEEVAEYIVKGLGLDFEYPLEDLYTKDGLPVRGIMMNREKIQIEHNEGRVMDPVECADGLADVNVVSHFNAHWHGFNLDRATSIVNDSNMSKLGEDGKPIINGVTEGYRVKEDDAHTQLAEAGFDPSKPIGKILKGPNFYEPTSLLTALIGEEGNNQP